MENQTNSNQVLDNLCINQEEDGHHLAYWRRAIVEDAKAADHKLPKQFKYFRRDENDAVTQMLFDLDNERKTVITQFQNSYDVSEQVELRDTFDARQSSETALNTIKSIYAHNDPILTRLNEELLSIREMEYEKLYGPEKQELMEIYQTGDADIDQEFEHELECCLHGKIQTSEEELQQKIKLLNNI